MKESVRQRLLAINRAFYQDFGASFSGTRFGAQPGWDRIIHHFPAQGAVLDLGCGNGRLALFLERKCGALAPTTPPAAPDMLPHAADADEVRRTLCHYVGVDGSAALLEIARQKTANLSHIQTNFVQADLSTEGWQDVCGAFDVITALAVLHHIPGFAARARIMRAARACLRPRGVLILSNWRFAQSERMQRKILPWDSIGLRPEDVEPGDYLLDWKKDGRGTRYAHQLDEAEIEALAAESGFTVSTQFVADGREENLSLYSILTPEAGKK